MKKEDIKKVVLAYSGGLDTSCIIPWLKENYNNCEVIAACADLGQGDELNPVYDKAIKTGASKCYILDLKEEFISDYVWPTVKAGAVYEKKYLLGTSFARPLIAKKLVEIAEKEGADAIAHGATGKGNDQVRFELAVKALNPDLAIVAPWREWELRSRDQEIDYAAAHNIPIPVSHDHDYSMDRNMWHLSHEGSDLEDPWNAPKDELFIVTNIPEKAPDRPEYVELEYVEGVPVSEGDERLNTSEFMDIFDIPVSDSQSEEKQDKEELVIKMFDSTPIEVANEPKAPVDDSTITLNPISMDMDSNDDATTTEQVVVEESIVEETLNIPSVEEIEPPMVEVDEDEDNDMKFATKEDLFDGEEE